MIRPLAQDDDETDVKSVPPEPNPARTRLSLTVLSGPERGRNELLHQRTTIVGRAAECEVTINDPGISRNHARIESIGDRHIIADLGSTYGLFVENEKVEQHELRDGERVHLSPDTVVSIRFQDPREQAVIGDMRQAAFADELTGVANRRYMHKRLSEELSFAQRHRAAFSVLFIDVDHFKRVNDTHGHLVGDELLSGVARVILQIVRTEDVVGRYGGDEFVVLARGYTTRECLRFAERLRQAVARRKFKTRIGEVQVTLSVGVAGFDVLPESEQPKSVDELLTRADSALYASKRAGRNASNAWMPPSAAPDASDEETGRFPADAFDDD